MIENIESIIAIVGCQRSGTTLTGQILGAHPNAILIDETDGLYKWFEGLQSNSLDIAENNALLKRADQKYTEREKRTIQPGMQTRNGGYQSHSVLSSRVSHLVLKSPNLTYSFESLSQLDIPVNIVYPVRDARAVVSSMEKLSHIPFIENQIRWISRNDNLAKRYESDLAQLKSNQISSNAKRAIVWRIKSGMAEDFTEHGLRVHSFLYEKLIGDSRSIVNELSEFTGLSFCESMLTHETVYVGEGPGGTKRFRPIDNQSLIGWKEQMTKANIEEVSQIAEPLMASLGY